MAAHGREWELSLGGSRSDFHQTMQLIIFVAPYHTENTVRFIEALVNYRGLRVGLISQQAQETLPHHLAQRLAGHWRIADALDAGQIAHAARALSGRLGPIHRLLGAVEQIQVQLAQVREWLDLPGMRVEAALNFRDKARMKSLLRAAGVPCARYRYVAAPGDAYALAAEIDFPLVVKPLSGAGSQATFFVSNDEELQQALTAVAPGADNPAIVEEFITGEEHSFETISIEGRPIWHSLTRYSPSPLDAVRNPWIQWTVVLPREIDAPQYDDIRAIGTQALAALGMQTGMSHLEWFRRSDGSIAVSEVAARPPGAQITTLIARANDIDFLHAWLRVMIDGQFDPPERRYAVGAAFLRGMGHGRVRAVRGLERAQKEIGWLITDLRLPQVGQEKSLSYEGEGYIIVRHPETAVVEQALRWLISTVRVELG